MDREDIMYALSQIRQLDCLLDIIIDAIDWYVGSYSEKLMEDSIKRLLKVYSCLSEIEDFL